MNEMEDIFYFHFVENSKKKNNIECQNFVNSTKNLPKKGH